jgi:hypothetical protein
MDIIFGPDIAIGNVHYGLQFTDQFSRMTHIYPLQNLTSDIRKQVEAFLAHLGLIPHCSLQTREYLNGLFIHVNAAPAYRQDKTDLQKGIGRPSLPWLKTGSLQPSFQTYSGSLL